MQAAIKFANACEFDHRKAFHIPHFDFFEESASASPMLFNGSASADRGRVSDKSNSATSLTQGLSAPLKLSKTRRLTPEDPSRWITLRVSAAANANTWKVVKRQPGDRGSVFAVEAGKAFRMISFRRCTYLTMVYYRNVRRTGERNPK